MKPLQTIARLIVNQCAPQKLLLTNKQGAHDLAHAQTFIIDTAGIITRNEMIVSHLFADNKRIVISGKGYYTHGTLFAEGKEIKVDPGSNLYRLAQGLQLLSSQTNTTIDQRGTFHVHGNSIQAALHVLAAKMGITEKDVSAFKKIEEKSVDVHSHAVLFEYQKKGIVFIVGSADSIMQRAGFPLPLENTIQEFQNNGLQSILIAYKECELTDDLEKIISNNLIILGICGIEDAIRSDAIPAISKARKAGFHIVMTTHDHQRTAISIAKQVGIYKEGDDAIDGSELATMSDQVLQEQLMHTTVYSGISVQQKSRIIDSFKVRNVTVLMSTEFNVSFSNIIRSIEDQRHSFNTLERILVYCFSMYVAQFLIILAIGFATLFYPPFKDMYPITIVQFLGINVAIIGFFSWALTLEKKEPKILFDERWQHQRSANLINKFLIIQTLPSAIMVALGTVAVFILYAPYNQGLAQTMALMTFLFFESAYAWNCRSTRLSLFKIGFLSNKWLIFGPGILAVLAGLFLAQPLNPYQWGFAVLAASCLVVLGQIIKWYFHRWLSEAN